MNLPRAQTRLRAESEQLLREQALSSGAHGPPRPPRTPAVEPLDLNKLQVGLPPGWRCRAGIDDDWAWRGSSNQ